ncbi:hypothetical protein [Flavisphingomonas formosensis]|uniref:hypothetical protein n=1 Tax=Flavisphingomonas formosensis TaxID=861534 RepID=UPI0012FCF5E0|nr:hypothetical protein [Sphingomonas formosensis]
MATIGTGMMALLIASRAIAAQDSGEAPKPAAAQQQPQQEQQRSGEAPKSDGVRDTVRTGGKIVAQPAHDVGLAKTKIPPVLEAARDNPYGTAGLKTCAQIGSARRALNDVLGPDFDVKPEKKENRAGKLAEAGGKSVVNAFIPFRGLVREISGAAPEERRLNEAISAGYARRGFLRGLAASRRCR